MCLWSISVRVESVGAIMRLLLFLFLFLFFSWVSATNTGWRYGVPRSSCECAVSFATWFEIFIRRLMRDRAISKASPREFRIHVLLFGKVYSNVCYFWTCKCYLLLLMLSLCCCYCQCRFYDRQT